MPSSQAVRALDPRREFKDLSDLYLMLWKQLDVLLGEGKWLDIVPSPPADLKLGADQSLRAMDATISDGQLRKVLQADYARVQDLVLHPDAAPKPEIESFKDYLRDEALRYTEDAYPIIQR
jgi:hypothetical protein